MNMVCWKLLLCTLALVLLAEGTVAQFLFTDTYLDVTTTQISFSWSASDGGVPSNFTLEIDNKVCDVTDRLPVSCNKTGLTPGETYTVKYTADGGTTVSRDVTTVPLEPTIVSLSGSSTTQLSLTFRAAAGGVQDHFEVQCGVSSTPLAEAKDVTGCDQPGECTIDIASLFDPNTMPGTEFTVYVTAVAADGATKSETASQSGHTWPRQPGPLTLVRREATTLVVSWVTADTVKTGHQVEVVPTVPGLDLSQPVPEVNGNYTLTLSPLTPGTPYTLTVRTQIGDESSEPTSGAFYTKPDTPGSAPVRKEVNVSSLLVTWTAVTEGAFNNYVITVAKTTTPATVLQTGRVSKGTLEYTFGSLEAGFEHNVTLQTAVDVGGDQEILSDTVSTSMHTKPKPPGSLSLKAGTRHTMGFTVTWDPPEDGFYDRYQVKVNSVAAVDVTKGDDPERSFTSLAAGTSHGVEVWTVSGDQNSAEVTDNFYTAPNHPRNLRESAKEPTRLVVQWDVPAASSPVDHYRIQLGTESPLQVAKQQTSHVFTSLGAGVDYFITLVAVTGDVDSVTTSINVTMQPMPPTSLVESTKTTSSLTFTWVAPVQVGPVSIYTYRVSRDGTGGTTVAESNTTSLVGSVNSGLTAGATYTVEVWTITKGERSQPASTQVTLVPLPVSGLSNPSIGPNTITVSWTKPAGISNGSDVSWTSNSAVSGSQSVDGAKTRYEISGLLPGTSYTVSVVSSSSGVKGQRVSATFATQPDTVTGLSRVDYGIDYITVSWNEPAGVTIGTYELRISPNDASLSLPVSVDSSASRTYTFSSLTPGRLYTLSIVVVANGQRSEAHSQQYRTKPRPVKNLAAQTLDTSRIRLTFEAGTPLGEQDKFTIQYGQRTQDVSYDSSVTQYIETLQLLATGGTFIFIVKAVSGQENSDTTEISQTTKPAPVTITRSLAVNSTAVRLSWNPDSNSVQSGYRYRYRVESGSDGDWIDPIPTQDTDVHVGGLKPGQKYLFEIEAVSGGQFSVGREATIVLYPLPPVDVTVDRVDTTSVTLSWTYDAARSVNTGWYIRYQVRGSSVKQNAGFRGLNDRRTTISGLVSGQNYTVEVYGRTHDGVESTEAFSRDVTIKPQITTTLFEFVNQTTTTVLAIGYPDTTPDGVFDHYVFSLNKTGSQKVKAADDLDRRVTFDGLTPGTYYRVMGKTVSGAEASDVIDGYYLTVPETPVVGCGVVTNDKINIDITYLASGLVDKYEVKCTGGCNPSSQTVTASDGKQVAMFSGLQAYKDYAFDVKSVRQQNSLEKRSDKVTVQCKAQESAPSPVGSFNFASIEPDRVTLNWTEPISANGFLLGYIITYSATKQGKSDIGPRNVSLEPDVMWVDISELKAGYRYVFQIRARNRYIGESSYLDATLPIRPPLRVLESSEATPVLEGESKPTSVDIQFINPFSNRYGDVVEFSVIVLPPDVILDSEDDALSTWSEAQVTSQPYAAIFKCPDLFLQGNGCWNKGATQRRRKRAEPGKDVVIEVGGDSSCQENATVYCNGPLLAATEYNFLLRGYTEDGQYTDAYVSAKISTAEESFDYLPVAVAVPVLLVLAVLIVVVLLYLRRRGQICGDDAPDNEGKMAANRLSMGVMQKRDPIPIRDFSRHVKKMMADPDTFAAEFEDFKNVGRSQTQTAAKLPANEPKNRFKNTLPYDHSLVKLQPLDGEGASDYVNASWIPGYSSKHEFIATQNPLPETRGDFWRLIWEYNCRTIVMLNNPTDTADQYLSKRSESFNGLRIDVREESRHSDWCARRIGIAKGQQSRQVSHFQFLGWPNNGLPTPESFVAFARIIRVKIGTSGGPLLVHCSAGSGRSGTFIAVDRLLQATEDQHTVDVYGTVKDMRMYRPCMVQTEPQYVFIHQCLQLVADRHEDQYEAIMVFQGDNTAYETLPEGQSEYELVSGAGIYVNQ